MPRCVIIGSKLPSIVFQTVTGNSSASSSYSFTSQPIGTASSKRYVIVAAIGPSASPSTLSCTVAGNAATSISGATARNSGIEIAMWKLLVTSGTTATIAINGTAGLSSCHIGVWALYDPLNAGVASNATTGGSAGTSLSLNVNTALNSVGCRLVLDSANVSWSGATEDYDGLVASKWMTGASFSGAAVATPRSVSVTCSLTGLYGNFASFR